MFEQFATAHGPTTVASLNLNTVWRVDADPTYDIHCDFSRRTSQSLNPLGGQGFIAVRTLDGVGRLYLEDQEPLDLPANTLAVTHWNNLCRYHCRQKNWNFWWFEFFLSGPLHAPLHTCLHIPSSPDELTQLETIFTLLRKQSASDRHLASAQFTHMFYSWLAHYHGKTGESPYKADIDSLIEAIYSDLGRNWTVSEMAAAANMSERNFRKVFAQITGQGPKAFYDNIRLSMAREMLRLQNSSVKQVANTLGYSSEFHLSKAFKKKFGYPPLKAKLMP
ncbi:Bacillibactin transport regulator [Anaerohalosphaera lusitana]|uniref:Bacillibactin transport regulator n=1 Tax=Anaerohalosphaera lusitana TaxID=1936003 RepID=A0A1U9NKK1_9BACT|nr:AraC family transcriptional regulator [Anaerohalosphaera lusitana]AQT68268.1 Bacillibactin transport regulator [Anaerohalosphaera lusitana]